jgi:dTMP kinase
MKPLFITLEGIEGSGKSTQAARLVEHLRAAGHLARQTREPGGTPLADAIRAVLLHPEQARAALASTGLAGSAAERPDRESEAVLPYTEVFLLSAARVQHVAVIREWREGGEIVVCDRFADATLAYQGYARGLDLAALRTIEHLATGGLTPDLTVLFDLDPLEGQRRKQRAHLAGAELNRLDQESDEFHRRVREGYLRLAAADPVRWIVLDAAQPANVVAEQVWQAVAARLTVA